MPFQIFVWDSASPGPLYEETIEHLSTVDEVREYCLEKYIAPEFRERLANSISFGSNYHCTMHVSLSLEEAAYNLDRTVQKYLSEEGISREEYNEHPEQIGIEISYCENIEECSEEC